MYWVPESIENFLVTAIYLSTLGDQNQTQTTFLFIDRLFWYLHNICNFEKKILLQSFWSWFYLLSKEKVFYYYFVIHFKWIEVHEFTFYIEQIYSNGVIKCFSLWCCNYNQTMINKKGDLRCGYYTLQCAYCIFPLFFIAFKILKKHLKLLLTKMGNNDSFWGKWKHSYESHIEIYKLLS